MSDAVGNLKALLDTYGLAPRKKLGQHFLTDPGALERIAARIDALAREGRDGAAQRPLPVVEIGPGPGVLTRALLDRGLDVLAIELDHGFAPLHRARFVEPLEQGRLQVHYGDALRLDDALVATFCAARGADRYILAGNIPYQITSPLLFQAVEQFYTAPAPAAVCFLMQEEVARRVAATPGGKVYGVLSVKLQLVAEPRLDVGIGSGAFWPPPKVGSRLLVVRPRERAERPDLEAYRRVGRLIDASFQQRRKMIAKVAAGAVVGGREAIEAFLAKRGLPVTARPEELAPADFLALSRVGDGVAGGDHP